jgi:hypothetical protein
MNFIFSKTDRRLIFYSPLGIVRWQKRVHYYLYKIKWNQYNDEIAAYFPNAETSIWLRDNFFSEYEVFRRVD